MTTFFRRASAAILKMLSMAGTPSTIARAVQLYANTFAGTIQAMAVDTDGQIYQVSPLFGPCETSMYFADDFLNTSTSTVNNTNGSTTYTTSNAGNPGIARQTVTAVNDATRILPAAGDITGMIPGGGAPIFFEGCCRTPTAQDGTDQWTDRWGSGDQTGAGTGDNTDGIYFESNRSLNGDNNVRLCTANASTRTKTSMGVAPTAGTFQRWKWICNSGATSVQGYLNDTATGAAVTTNIPTSSAAVYIATLLKTLGSNARTVDRDYLETYQLFNSPRT